jgi:flagellar basal-body rod protein FlgC
MSLFSALDINASGLTAQRRRIEVISSNLANANTTRTAEGTPYKRKDLVFESAPVSDGFGAALTNEMVNGGGEAGVEIAGIYEDGTQFIRRYEPSHPDADGEGYVLYPNVSPIEEMGNLLSATRSFEANVQSMNAIKELARKSLEIGK